MSDKYTSDKLNELPKEVLVFMVLSMQDQLTQMNARLDALTEQIAIANSQRFGRRTEKLSGFDGQGSCAFQHFLIADRGKCFFGCRFRYSLDPQFLTDPAGTVFPAALLYPEFTELLIIQEVFFLQLINHQFGHIVGIVMTPQVLRDLSFAAGATGEQGDRLIQGARVLMQGDKTFEIFAIDR